jgi:hypothetical protein
LFGRNFLAVSTDDPGFIAFHDASEAPGLYVVRPVRDVDETSRPNLCRRKSQPNVSFNGDTVPPSASPLNNETNARQIARRRILDAHSLIIIAFLVEDRWYRSITSNSFSGVGVGRASPPTAHGNRRFVPVAYQEN